MADSEKAPVKKPALDKDTTVLSQGRIQMKPAAKKVTYTTSVLKCACQSTLYGAYCFVHYNKAKVDQPITQHVTEDLSDSVEEPDYAEDYQNVEASKEHLEKEVKALAAMIEEKKRKKGKPSAPKAAKEEKPEAPLYAPENSCVFKWKKIEVGTVYKAMSVGRTPRSRTGIVLVPINSGH